MLFNLSFFKIFMRGDKTIWERLHGTNSSPRAHHHGAVSTANKF